MTIARTVVPLVIQNPVGVPDAHCMEGMVAQARAFAITDSSDTTAEIYLGGLIPWRIINESGGAATYTFYDAIAPNGTALVTKDDDHAIIAALTVADDESDKLVGLDGCTHLVIKGAAASSGHTLVCKR